MPLMTPAEIDAAEAEIGVRLPGLYRELLAEVGHGRRGDCEIYHPSAVRALYEPFFDDPAQLFAPYFPFGCDNGLQELWVIDGAAARAASIWHETVPDDWPEEQWLPYDEWRRQHFSARGSSG
jgi:hypothetical protein